MAAPAITMEVLLNGLLDKTNAVRKQAEEYYLSQVSVSDEAMATMLMQLLMFLNNAAATESQRILCAVLLRRLLERRSGNWVKLPADKQAAVRQGLLAAFVNEPKRHLQERMAHTIAEVAATAGGDGCKDWPELLTAVFTMAQQSTPSASGNSAASVRAMSLFMFTRLAEYSGRKLLAPHAGKLLPVMQHLLKDDDNNVRVAAMRGTIALITALDADESEDAAVAAAKKASQALVPELLQVLQRALLTDEYAAKDGLVSLIDLLRADPVFLRPYIAEACNCMLVITRADTFDDATRRLGLEFVVALGEYAGATLRKMTDVIKAVVQQSLQFLCMVDEDPKWVVGEDDPYGMIGDEAESDSADMVIAGASALDRLALGVGGKALWPILSEQVAPMLGSADWKHRRAALLAISLVSEGCKKFLAPQVRTVVSGVAGFVRDSHPRVRHAACRCLGEMIGDFSDPNSSEDNNGALPAEARANTTVSGGTAARAKGKDNLQSIQDAAGDIILPALIESMGPLNAGTPRVRSIAALACVNFTMAQYCSEDNLKGHERPLLAALFSILTDVGLKGAKEGAITSVACIAQVIEDRFVEFYPTFVPIAKNLIATCTGKEYSKLRGQALQAISFIAEAVGREVAGVDSAEMLNVILRHMASGIEVVEDEPDNFDYAVQATGRFAAMLGADFVPYLQFVVPLLLVHANKEVEMTVLDADGPEADEDDEEANGGKGMVATDVKLPDGGRRRLAINPAKLSTKLAAITGLCNLLDDLGVEVKGFYPFTVEITKCMVANLQAKFASLREMAANGLHYCVMSALADVSNPAKGQQVFEACLDGVMEALDHEAMVEVQMVLGEELETLVKLSYESLTDGNAVTGPSIVVSQHVLNAVSVAAAIKNTAAAKEAQSSGAAAIPEEDRPTPHTVCVLPEDRLPDLLGLLQEMLESSHRRRAVVIREVAANPDADEEDAERLDTELEGENDFVSHCVDTMGYAIKTHRAAVLPIIGKDMYPYLMQFVANKQRFMEPFRAAAICMGDDLIEHASPESQALLPSFLPSLLDAADPDTDGFVRQAAVYGLGLCAQYGGDAFAPHVGTALAKLHAIVTHPSAKEDENLSPTENAVSAILKIARFRAGTAGVDSDTLVSGVLALLPFKSDGIEARLVHGMLVTGICSMDPFWVGKDNSRVPACLSALSSALIAHDKNMESSSPADAAEGGDEEEEEDDDADALFEEGHLAQLRGFLQAAKTSPHAAAIAAIVKGLKKKQQTTLAKYGLALA